MTLGGVIRWQDRGPWISFQTPVAPPAAVVTDPPQYSLCANEDWIPYILGALKVLTRDMTWKGTDAQISDAVDQANMLLSSVVSGCGLQVCPEFYLVADSTHCPFDLVHSNLYVIDECGGCPGGEERTYMGVAKLNAFGQAVLGISCRQVSDDAPCGGHFCKIDAHQTDFTVANVFNVLWLDCLGNIQIENVGGEHYVKTGITAQYVCITSLAPFAVSYSIDGPVICLSV